MQPTVSIHLDTRRIKLDKTFPVKIRISFESERPLYGIKLALNQEDFTAMYQPNPSGRLKKYLVYCNKKVKEAEAIIESITDFSFPIFEELFLQKPKAKYTLLEGFKAHYTSYEKEGREQSFNLYRNAMNALKRFKANVDFPHITVDFLNRFEQYNLDKGNSITTVRIYFICLRTILGKAIEDKIIKKDVYPFGKKKYVIPIGKNVKKALTKEQLKLIFEYQPKKKNEKKAKDFWLFSYLANGMNFKDIARLKYSDIVDGNIVFYRAKTLRTRKNNPKSIVIIITKEIEKIIYKWGNLERDGYIFPILYKGVSFKDEDRLIKQFIKRNNHGLRNIAHILGINKDVNTYAARHSFSTILRDSGIPVHFIKESLGHASLTTTENYLASFPTDLKASYVANLTRFK